MTTATAEKAKTTVNFPWLNHPSQSDNPIVVALSDRLAWAKTKGDEPLWPNGPTAQAYVQGFVRTSGMGSHVKIADRDMTSLNHVLWLFESLGWEEITPDEPAPGHKYYQAVISVGSIFSGYQSAVTLDRVADFSTVRVRKGPHGFELYTPDAEGRAYTRVVSAIVDKDGLVTWYPGEITPKVDLAKATVKLI